MPYFKYNEKKIYYEERGKGKIPLMLLHGNTASSKMFDNITALYEEDFRIFIPDFLGHGKSDRITEIPANIWYEEALQTVELLKHINMEKMNIIGTSGGALAAINAALLCPEKISGVIADSFEGEYALEIIAESIENERENSKSDNNMRKFWEENHGKDWEQVVDMDTKAIIKHYKTEKTFFRTDLSELKVPVLLTGSLEDEYAEYVSFEKTYGNMKKKIPEGSIHMFKKGGHPAFLTAGNEFFKTAKEFFKEK
jgi:pimeloyl-ACP methyl ester carboxylesterase